MASSRSLGLVNYVVVHACEIAAKWFFAGIVQSDAARTFYVYKQNAAV